MLDVRAGVVKVVEVAPETGLVVTPEEPTYHWKVVGEVPEAVTLKVAVFPVIMVVDAGWVVMTGRLAVVTTVTIAVLESAVP